MSAATLTIIFGYRNREPERVDRCLASLAAQTRKDFVVLFVDYGSWPQQAAAAKAVVEKYPFARYIYTDTRGWPWNRSHALNIGIRMARTSTVLTTDVDIVFSKGFLGALLGEQDGQSIVHCAPVLMPKGMSDYTQLTSAQIIAHSTARTHRGTCQCFPLPAIVQVRGFDEYYRVWGREDEDLAQRLIHFGLADRWINGKVTIYHVWHPVDAKRHSGIEWALNWARMAEHYEINKLNLIRNSDKWGRYISSEDRQVYRFVDSLSLETRLSLCHEYRYDPNDSDAFTGLFEMLCNLPRGEAMAVTGCKFPRINARNRCIQDAINKGMEALGMGVRLEYPVNYLHAILNDYICKHAEVVADYFLGCGRDEDLTVLVRA